MAQFPSDTAADGIWSLKQQRRALLGSAWPALSTAAIDEYFANVTLLLHGDGTNGSQNNTFLDSSSNNFTITSNGNTTQGSYSPYGNRWSNYFDGTGDRLQVPAGSDFAYGTGDFTVEGWFYATAEPVQYGGALFSQTVSGTNYFWVAAGTNASSSAKRLRFTFATSGAGTHINGATDYALNTWNHFAVVRQSGTITLYLNGVADGSGSCTQDFTNTTYLPTIGGYTHSTTECIFEGYISDLHVVKGTALYTSAFTPPIEPLTAVSGTSLLTCQSNRFKDNSSNDFAITVNGDTKVTPFSPYAPSAAYTQAEVGGSGYFDGAGDWLNAGSDTAFAFGTGDFTIELWFYANSIDDTNETFVCTNDNTSTNADWQLGVSTDNGNEIQLKFGSGPVLTYPVSVNQWYHLAVVRSGTDLSLYVNGVEVDTATSSNDFSVNGPLKIGENRGGTKYFDGYLSDLRIIKGTALYTSAFTPPTAPLAAVTNTSLLCSFTNAGIFDSTGKNVLETVGNAQIDTAVKKFGTGSMEFDGAGDYLSMPQSTQTQFGDGDFTIEGWFYRNNTNDGTIYGDRGAVAVYGGLLIGFRNNYVFIAASVNGSSWAIDTYASTAGSTVSAATWTHIAIVRSGSTCSVYINGTESYNRTLSGAIVQTESNVLVGADPASAVPTFNGYIDDLRITKGVARYTANFTPPIEAFPDQGPDFMDYLIVAGGGGGGSHAGGGGGAGGLIYSTNQTITSGTYTVTVGGGGAGHVYVADGTGGKAGSVGADSVFNSETAIGGGGGGARSNQSTADRKPTDGGSGGGGGNEVTGTTPGSGTAGQGNDGGFGFNSGGNSAGGGGGGAGSVGGNAASVTGGTKGSPSSNSITGSSVDYAEGGGGAAGLGPSGIGGGSVSGIDGAANLGGGGGGSEFGANSGSGGSGVVIIRTLATAASTTGSPTVTTDGSYNIYTFTGSGSITF